METGGLMADEVCGVTGPLCSSTELAMACSSVWRECFVRSPVGVCVTYAMFTVFTSGGNCF